VSDVEPNAVTDPDTAAELPPPAREGLPKNYSMRADRHYVEQLIGDRTPLRDVPVNEIEVVEATDASTPVALIESIRTVGVLQPLLVNEQHGRYRLIAGRTRLRAARIAGLTSVPCLVHRVARDEADALAAAEAIGAVAFADMEERARWSRSHDLLSLISDQAGAIDAAERLLAGGPRGLAWRPARDLIRAHARRAAWLIQAITIVEDQSERHRGREPLGAMIARLSELFEAESRLTGIDLRVRIDDQAYAVRIGSDTLVAGLLGAVVSLAPWEGATNAEPVVLTANASNGGLIVEIWRANARIDPALVDRFFDATFTNRPGGWVAAIGAGAFKAAVEASVGDVLCRVRDRDTHLTATFS
jgi:hypothetical protein